MLAPSLLQAAIDGLDEVSSVQVQGIEFVCRPDGIKHRFNLTGDTEHLPVQIFDLTFPDEFPLENVNQAASQLINGMNNMKSLKKEYFFCSERVNGITEGRDYPLMSFSQIVSEMCLKFSFVTVKRLNMHFAVWN